jgi:hypothetical protein
MLINSNDVAKRLNLSNRAIQIKCKQRGLVKIGNKYQITKEIAEEWYKDSEVNKETKTKRNKENNNISQRNNKVSSFAVYVLAVMVIFILAMFYLNLDSQIIETKKELQQEKSEHKKEVKELNHQLMEATDIIHKKELEIQQLKFKDSLKLFRRN